MTVKVSSLNNGLRIVTDTMKDILGGLRSACAYTGATSLKDFAKTAQFVRVNRTHHDQTT